MSYNLTRPFGTLCTLKELSAAPEDAIVGRSVRVVGRLINYHFSEEWALIEHQSAKLLVDTRLLGDIAHVVGRLYQVLGELETLETSEVNALRASLHQNTPKCILRARIIRNVDGLDVNLYKEALKRRRAALPAEELFSL